ncbi:MAG TPA: ATPase, T2SS/T4P/T4SS family, partial [Blastococcus sp.]
NVEGVGQVTLRDLVRQALRMRPDRLVVGEVRGAEVTDLLAALNTGHDGGCGTLHANRPSEVPARLEALGVAAGLGRTAVHSQAAAALALVVHLRRTPVGRRVDEIGVVRRSAELVVVEPGWRADGGPCPARERMEELLAGEQEPRW